VEITVKGRFIPEMDDLLQAATTTKLNVVTNTVAQKFIISVSINEEQI